MKSHEQQGPASSGPFVRELPNGEQLTLLPGRMRTFSAEIAVEQYVKKYNLAEDNPDQSYYDHDFEKFENCDLTQRDADGAVALLSCLANAPDPQWYARRKAAELAGVFTYRQALTNQQILPVRFVLAMLHRLIQDPWQEVRDSAYNQLAWMAGEYVGGDDLTRRCFDRITPHVVAETDLLMYDSLMEPPEPEPPPMGKLLFLPVRGDSGK